MRNLMLAAAATMLTLTAAPVIAAAPASVPAPATKMTTSDTTIGALLDNPASKAVLMKHIPALVGNAQIDMARSMTLKQIQAYAGDGLSDEVLAKIDVDLAAIK